MKVRSHRDLDVYRLAFQLAMKIFDISKTFPPEEKYSLTDQIRRSSRSVCANIGEAFRKRRYEKSFIVKLNDAESEAAESQVWIEFAQAIGYLSQEGANDLYTAYDGVIGKLITMSNQADKWSV
jgi:four helix bundle protein